MGWASGSELAEDVWTAVRKHVPEDKRKSLATRIVRLFEGHDCDTLNEVQTLMEDANLREYAEEE